MRKRVKLVLLSVLLGSSCLHEKGCFDCDVDGDPDCRADVTGRSAVPPPPPPPAALSVACRSRNTRPDAELEWELAISGGTSPFTYTIDFGDGTPAQTGRSLGSSPHGSHEYSGAGDYQMTAEVRDQGGQVQSCVLAYTASAPDLRLRCTATPRTGTAPLTVTFDAPASGRDGCVGPCEVTWDFGDGQTQTGGHAVHVYELPGPSAFQTYAAFATLTDSLGRTAQCRRPIEVLPNPNAPPPTNQPPSIDYLAANPSSISAGQSSTIFGTTSDPDPGDTVSWSLSFDTGGAGTLSPTTGAGPNIQSTYTSAVSINGTVSIRAAAVDSAGAVSSYRIVNVTVGAPPPSNRPPVITGFTASPATIGPGSLPSNLSATVSDPDGDPVTWTLALDPSSTTTGTFSAASGSGNVSSQFSAPPGTTPGQAVIRLVVTDSQGNTAQATVTVNVILG